jgi:catechol 2,3-dioxygenase-like lactoylglutathione lyase family enzyme
MTAVVTGFNHVAVVTEDLDRLIDFYGAAFGLEVGREVVDEHRHAVLRVGADSLLHAFEVPDNPHAVATGGMLDRGHLDHLAFTAPDLEAFEDIRARLVELGASDGEVRDFGIGYSLSFRDPDGMSSEVLVMLDDDLSRATEG